VFRIGTPYRFHMDATIDRERTKRVKLGGGRAYHSRLEPFVDFIRAQRRAGKTWAEVAELLRRKKNCASSFQGVHQFYRRFVERARKPHWEKDTPSIFAEKIVHSSSKPLLAVTPAERLFRRPNTEDLTLNDPTTL
jgi:hypothetical protein